ncbi:MAG: 6-phosphogluconolactonase [Anaerolineae bacterium]|nr:6-phosphogluconolactonase [Anaerolineae bacterium]
MYSLISLPRFIISQLLVFPHIDELYQTAAGLFVQAANEAMMRHGRFTIALSGGGTPQPLYRLLSQPPFRDQIPWDKTHVFWGDERLVPPDHAESSYGLTARLLLDHVPIPPIQVHRALGEVDAVTAVADYTTQLAQLGSPWPRFDLILLGMGHDGHTASLFPGPIPPQEVTDPVMAVTANYDGRPARRITFTPRLINQAHQIVFLATGANKAQALHAVLSGAPNPEKWPAQRIAPRDGRVTWLVDAAAAQLLPHR